MSSCLGCKVILRSGIYLTIFDVRGSGCLPGYPDSLLYANTTPKEIGFILCNEFGSEYRFTKCKHIQHHMIGPITNSVGQTRARHRGKAVVQKFIIGFDTLIGWRQFNL
jgi:hypothetical protein